MVCLEPGKEGCKDWLDPVFPLILPFLVQDKLPDHFFFTCSVFKMLRVLLTTNNIPYENFDHDPIQQYHFPYGVR